MGNDFASPAQLLRPIPHSVTIAVPGSGHVVYLGGATEVARQCVSGYLGRYLLTLELPAVGAKCPM